MNIDKNVLAIRKASLIEVGKQLKTEFFGLDLIIDKAIDSVYAWYVFPELIKRPVIVNLWGMTGVGKTQLVRRISALLGFSKKFVEIQMDGTSGGSTYRKDSICSILSNCINEGEVGILLLDEIQRFRTIDESGADVKVERFQDVWMLLSDGKFAANSDLFLELEMMIAQQEYKTQYAIENTDIDEDGDETSSNKPKKPIKRHFQVHPYEARMLKQSLRLSEPITEIMTWDAKKVDTLVREIRNNKIDWQIDYSKLLIFVSGNLDRAFAGSTNTEDYDTDADFYHKTTSQLTSSDIKHALGSRFKPEQISRLGSNHIIYPSMSKLSYQQLIKSSCDKYIIEMNDATNIRFTIQPQLYEIIYNNSVYPTQGTRPVFSAVHKIFSTGLVNIACWCLENDIFDVVLEINEQDQMMVAMDVYTKEKYRAYIDLEISKRKAKISLDIKTLVAVHESGHAVMYALLTKSAPLETKINATSYSQGYVLPNEGLTTNTVTTKRTLRNRIAILLSGMIAEEMIFGPDNRSAGCSSDIVSATLLAGQYIRHYGYDGTLSYINTALSSSTAITWNTNLDNTNSTLETILQEEYDHAKTLITENFQFYRKLVDTLLEVNVLDQVSFIETAKEYIDLGKDAQIAEFNQQYLNFSSQ